MLTATALNCVALDLETRLRGAGDLAESMSLATTMSKLASTSKAARHALDLARFKALFDRIRRQTIAARLPVLFDATDLSTFAFPIHLRIFVKQPPPTWSHGTRRVQDYVFFSDRVATWAGRVPFGDRPLMVHFSDAVEVRSYADVARNQPEHKVADLHFAYLWAQLPPPVPDIRFHCTMMSIICGRPYVQLQQFHNNFSPEERAAVAAYWGRLEAL